MESQSPHKSSVSALMSPGKRFAKTDPIMYKVYSLHQMEGDGRGRAVSKQGERAEGVRKERDYSDLSCRWGNTFPE